MKPCPYCGEMIQDEAIYCRFCNKYIPPTYNPGAIYPHQLAAYEMRNNPFDSSPEGKSRGIAALLAIFFPCIGLQYFYLGKIWGGIICILLCLVTFGTWSIINIIQGVLMLCMDNATFRRKYILSDSTFPLF